MGQSLFSYVTSTSSWHEYRRSHYTLTYDSVASLVETLEQNWNSAEERWDNVYRVLYTYEPDGTPVAQKRAPGGASAPRLVVQSRAGGPVALVHLPAATRLELEVFDLSGAMPLLFGRASPSPADRRAPVLDVDSGFDNTP